MAYIDHTKGDTPNLPELPGRAMKIIEEFESGSILGASKTVRLISEVFRIQANEGSYITGEELTKVILQAGDYFIQTRGALSPAVGNAVNWMLAGLAKFSNSTKLKDVIEHINKRTTEYDRVSLENVAKIGHYGANLFDNGQTVMAYDYSSSVNIVLYQAAKDGKLFTVVIPESRTLEGGIKILREVVQWGHRILFTADAAMGHEVKSCHGVLVGVESLTIDGGFWTTVGTRSLAILAKYYHTPFYVPTELIKIDPKSKVGVSRKVHRAPIRFFNDIPELHQKNISYKMDDLEFTPRELITSYITEEGIIPPEAVWSLSRKYL